MNRISVSSSTIASIGYDSENGTLEIEFVNGSIYQYFKVPPQLYSGLLSATSRGRYFDAYIKKGEFQYKGIDGGRKR